MFDYTVSVYILLPIIRDFPDHATFMERSVTTGLVGQAWGILSLTLCNKANFDPILLVKYDVLLKGLNMILTFYEMVPFLDVTHLTILVYLVF